MPAIVITQLAGATFGGSGKVFRVEPNLSYRENALPVGVNTVNQKPSYAMFNGDGISRLYIVGGHTDNMVMTENFAFLRQGILPPDNPWVAGAGSGNAIGVVASSGTGITANSIYYISFWDNIHERESPLSGPSPTLALVNKDVVGTNLPTTCADASVTHIRVWRSDAGNTPRIVCMRTLGATGFTDNTPTLSLGEAYDTDFEKFPRCKYNVVWHGRQVMAGDDRYPDRFYFSVLGQPERYGRFWRRTLKGEKVVALAVVRDNLIVFSATSCYVVTGYTEDDVSVNFLEPKIGCISHHGIVLIHGVAFVPTHIGIYACTGSSMHWISQDFGDTWLREYAANVDAYEAGWGENDSESRCYKFYCGSPSASGIDHVFNGKHMYWVLDYTDFRSETSGNFSSPDLSFDLRTRADSAMASIALPGGRRADLWVGGADGILRQENSATDLNDDSDTFAKTAIIRTKHYLPNGPGGDEADGSTFPTAWTFTQSEDAAYVVNLYSGDERASDAETPNFAETVPIGRKQELVVVYPVMTLYTMVPKTVHDMRPNIEGRGVTFELVQASAPVTTRWSGWGFTALPGRNNRSIALTQTLE
jgi:hypothetical protein